MVELSQCSLVISLLVPPSWRWACGWSAPTAVEYAFALAPHSAQLNGMDGQHNSVRVGLTVIQYIQVQYHFD